MEGCCSLTFSPCLVESASYKTKTTIPTMAQHKMSWTLPHQWHIENVLRLDLRKTFSQLEFFPSDNTSLCQSDMQLSSTEKKNPHYCVIIITPNIILENIKMINAIQAFMFHESVNLFCLKYNMNLIKPSEKKISFSLRDTWVCLARTESSELNGSEDLETMTWCSREYMCLQHLMK